MIKNCQNFSFQKLSYDIGHHMGEVISVYADSVWSLI